MMANGEPNQERDRTGTGADVEAQAPSPSGGADSSDRAGSADAERDASMQQESDERLDALQSELESLNDRHLRLAAEFDNYRKRIERERTDIRTRSQAELVKKLLEVLDDLQRVAEYDAETTSVEAVLEGITLVEKKYRHVLESAGLEPIDVSGEFFNPNTMEALMTAPAEHPEEDDVVADVFQKGYRFRDVLLRPARVRVKKYDEG